PDLEHGLGPLDELLPRGRAGVYVSGEAVQHGAHPGIEVGAVIVVEQGHRGVLLAARGGAGATMDGRRAHRSITRRNDRRPRWIALRTVACRQPRISAM